MGGSAGLLFFAAKFHPTVEQAVEISPVDEHENLFSRLPADRVLFEVGVHCAAYGRIEVCGPEAIE
jgi:hypothetical protein